MHWLVIFVSLLGVATAQIIRFNSPTSNAVQKDTFTVQYTITEPSPPYPASS